MSTEVDVVVVGGGPAGAAAAHLLATRGRSVLVCERSSFPRDKPCGDGLSPRGVRALETMGMAAEMRGWEQIRGVRVHAGGRSREFLFPAGGRWPAHGVVRRRRDLDAAILRRAGEAGAEVVHGAAVSGFVRAGDAVAGVVVCHEGSVEEVRAGWVICAEGAGGPLARSLGRSMQPGAPRTLAVRQYFPDGPLARGWFDVYTDTRSEGRIIPGYGWVFPMGDGTVNAGVGVITSLPGWRRVNLHDLQRSFLHTLPPTLRITPDLAVTPPRAGRVPMGAGVWPPHGPGFLLVGDAAGMVNPASGEGIAYALETGRMAARHVDDALRSGSSPVLDGYAEEVQAAYAAYFRLGRAIVRMVGCPVLAQTALRVSMMSKGVFDVTMTVMAHLDDDGPGRAQRGFRLLEAMSRGLEVERRP